MSKNVVEIDVVMGDPPSSIHVAKVVLVKKGDLYISRLAPDVMSGKHSYHESGITHDYVDLIQRRARRGRACKTKASRDEGASSGIWLGVPPTT